MANEIEKQTLNLFAMAVREFVGSFGTGSKNDLNLGRLLSALFLFAIAFLLVGVEALKVLFRRNFSRESVSIVQIVIASLAFVGWGWVCLSLKAGEMYSEMKGLTFAAWFYVAIGALVLVRGVFEWNKSYDKKNEGTLLGESILLGFLKNSWWNEYRLKMIAEPLTIFAIALPLTAMNFYLGIPLVFCGMSQVIFNLVYLVKGVEEVQGNSSNDKNQIGSRTPVQ
jgi:hypothetical protein